MSAMARRASLARRTMGAGSLWIFAVGASSPLTVLVGGIPQTYATTGVIGVPLSFALLAGVFGVLVVGYAVAGRHLPHAAPFYVLLGRGFGRKVGPTIGIAGALVALVGYNAIQISLYGLLGYTVVGMVGGRWWWWAVAAWAVVGAWGLLSGASSARLLGWVLAFEVGVIGCFIALAFAHPAGGTIHLDGLEPSRLLVSWSGFSGVLAFGMAALIGGETAQVYSEEAHPGTPVRATFAAVGFLGGFYLLAALAYSVWTGPNHVVAAARVAMADPTQGPLLLLGRVFGPGMQTLVMTQLVLSIGVSMISFHGVVARYAFCLARKGLFPRRLAHVIRAGQTSRGGAPKGGSIAQTVVAGLVLAVLIALDADPITVVFIWFSTVAALCILLLLVVAAPAAKRVLAQLDIQAGTSRRARFVNKAAPNTGLVCGVLLLLAMVLNLSALLGTKPGSRLTWLAPEIVAGAVLVGLLWGLLVHAFRPDTWAGVGDEVPHPLTAHDDRLARLEM